MAKESISEQMFERSKLFTPGDIVRVKLVPGSTSRVKATVLAVTQAGYLKIEITGSSLRPQLVSSLNATPPRIKKAKKKAP